MEKNRRTEERKNRRIMFFTVFFKAYRAVAFLFSLFVLYIFLDLTPYSLVSRPFYLLPSLLLSPPPPHPQFVRTPPPVHRHRPQHTERPPVTCHQGTPQHTPPRHYTRSGTQNQVYMCHVSCVLLFVVSYSLRTITIYCLLSTVVTCHLSFVI